MQLEEQKRELKRAMEDSSLLANKYLQNLQQPIHLRQVLLAFFCVSFIVASSFLACLHFVLLLHHNVTDFIWKETLIMLLQELAHQFHLQCDVEFPLLGLSSVDTTFKRDSYRIKKMFRQQLKEWRQKKAKESLQFLWVLQTFWSTYTSVCYTTEPTLFQGSIDCNWTSARSETHHRPTSECRVW